MDPLRKQRLSRTFLEYGFKLQSCWGLCVLVIFGIPPSKRPQEPVTNKTIQAVAGEFHISNLGKHGMLVST